jgi:GDP-L-fucose synthase
MAFLTKETRIYVAGHRGMAGSAILRNLKKKGFENLTFRTRQELDLTRQSDVESFFAQEKIDAVFLAAAKVGGIQANASYQADFLYENLAIASNVIHASAKFGVKKLLFLGSSCIYPRMAPQPLKESSLLTGPLETTNEGYAIAKIAGLKLCEMYRRQYGKNFISAMPTNLYGPGDNFHPENSHVIPGMMRRFHEAKHSNAAEVKVWGTGNPMREFLHVNDLADALVLLMDQYESNETINVGTGKDHTIRELAELMKEVTGYNGKIVFDSTKPDGTPRKVLDVSRVHSLNWKHSYSLSDGLKDTYLWALGNAAFDKK